MCGVGKRKRAEPACVTQSGRDRVSLESASRITNTFKRNISVVRNFLSCPTALDRRRLLLCFKTKKVTNQIFERPFKTHAPTILIMTKITGY